MSGIQRGLAVESLYDSATELDEDGDICPSSKVIFALGQFEKDEDGDCCLTGENDDQDDDLFEFDEDGDLTTKE